MAAKLTFWVLADQWILLHNRWDWMAQGGTAGTVCRTPDDLLQNGICRSTKQMISFFERGALLLLLLWVWTISTWLTLSLPSSKSWKSTFSQLSKRETYKWSNEIWCKIIFHLSKLGKAKFSIQCDVIYFWWGCRGNLKLITLGSERVIALLPPLQESGEERPVSSVCSRRGTRSKSHNSSWIRWPSGESSVPGRVTTFCCPVENFGVRPKCWLQLRRKTTLLITTTSSSRTLAIPTPCTSGRMWKNWSIH